MGKIQIKEGTWNTECTTELNLTDAQAKDPTANYDKVIMYAEKRQLMTFLTAGATNGQFTVPRTTKSYKTRVPAVPKGELIAGNAWKYDIMGRIQISSVILGTGPVGTPTAGSTSKGGFFNLLMKDNYIVPGMNVNFYNGKIARCMGFPTGGLNGYVYRFQCYPGDTFSWTTWVAPQVGQKTCFGGYTSYGERSLKGYGRVHYPDKYIEHMTIQRKGEGISGDANSERVLWYTLQNKGADGESSESRGWIYWIEAQARAQFLIEDEYNKKWGKSTMKDSLGNLLTTPSMIDEQTGMPLVAGNGAYRQIEGANDMETSGANGTAVYDDLADMSSALKKRSNADGGSLRYVVTGTDGLMTASEAILGKGQASYNITQILKQTKEVGGASPMIGFFFQSVNLGGDTLHFVVDPMMDDDERFPEKLSNGKSRMGSTYYFLDMSMNNTGRPNIEIRAAGRRGINRNMVYFYDNGMTGDGQAKGSVDGKEFQMLKQNMIVIYNTKACGILSPPATA